MSSLPSASHVPVITKKRRATVAKDMISQPHLATSTTLFALEDSHPKELTKRRSEERSRVSFDIPLRIPFHRRRGSEPAVAVSKIKETDDRRNKTRTSRALVKKSFKGRSATQKETENGSHWMIFDERNGNASRALSMKAPLTADNLDNMCFVDHDPKKASGMSLDGSVQMTLSAAIAHFRMDEFGRKVPDAPENIEDTWTYKETYRTEDEFTSRPQSAPILARPAHGKGSLILPRPIKRDNNPSGPIYDTQPDVPLTCPTFSSHHPLVESPSAYPMADYFSPRGTERRGSLGGEETGSDGSLLEICESLAHLNVASLEEEVLSGMHHEDAISPIAKVNHDLEFDSFIAFDDPSMEMEEELPFGNDRVLPESPDLFGRYNNGTDAPQEMTIFGTTPPQSHSPSSLFSHTNSSFGSLLSRFPVFVHQEPLPRSLFPKKRYTKRRNGVSITDYFDYAHLASQTSTPDQSFRALEPDHAERDVAGSKLRSVFED